MSNKYSRIEERINLQSLYNFFCHGADETILDFSSFEERELIEAFTFPWE